MKKIVTSLVLSGSIIASSFGFSTAINVDDTVNISDSISIFNRGMQAVNGPGKSRDVEFNEPINRVEVGEDFSLEGVEQSVEIDVNDPGVSAQWALARTNSYLLWDYIEEEQDETVYVAVLDTGVDYTHIDLENRVDESMGYDFVNDDDDPMDDNGHGTHVSGIIAAEMDNEEGIVGIVGDLDVVIIPIKVLDEDGTGDADDIEDGIEYAIEQGADIINLSFGGNVEDADGIEDAIDEAIDEDIIVVAAAGNDGVDCEDYIPTSIDGVYTVAASTMSNTLASFSNYGDCVEIVAPGVSIVSTVLDDEYVAYDGTSMAAPIVSGIAAMFKAYDEDLSADEITDLINESANELSESNSNYETGYGIIDAAGAYEDLTGEDIYDEDAMPDYSEMPMEGGQMAPETNIMPGQMTGPNMNVMPSGMTGPSMNNMPSSSAGVNMNGTQNSNLQQSVPPTKSRLGR